MGGIIQVVIVCLLLPASAFIIGLGAAVAVGRMTAITTAVRAGIVAAYVIGFLILAVLLNQVIPSLAWYDAAAISLVVTAGAIFFAVIVMRRTLFARRDVLTSEQRFTVFGEDQRRRRIHHRRR